MSYGIGPPSDSWTSRALGIEPDGLAQEDRGVGVPAEDAPQRLRDLARREGAGRDLVEQRLEQVVVAPVDQRQVDLGVALRSSPCGVQAAEPAADDDDAVRAGGGRGIRGGAPGAGMEPNADIPPCGGR